MGRIKKYFTFTGIARDQFVDFLLSGKPLFFPVEDENKQDDHVTITGLEDYGVIENDFSLRTTAKFNEKDYPAVMAGEISPYHVSGKILFYVDSDATVTSDNSS